MCHIKSINNVNNERLIGLAKSGCREIFIGIESGSKDILKKINKTSDVEIIIDAVKRVIDAGINVKGYFICGFPNEKEEDLIKTLDLAKLLTEYGKRNNARFRNSTFQFRPYYGTELYDNIVEITGLPSDYILTKTKVSKELNDMVRNKSFNFDSGNYSSVSDELLMEYINKMNNLNE